MKSRYRIIVSLFFVLSLLSACDCDHKWNEATCTSPVMCNKCGDVQGDPLPHTWNEATCSSPMMCNECGKTQGDTLPHTWDEATCSCPKKCRVCGEEQGVALSHIWREADCLNAKKCTLCGETEGNPLGHTEGELVTEIDMIYATRTTERQCTKCKARTYKNTVDLDKTYAGGIFLFSPSEFIERMNNKLDNISGNNIKAYKASVDGDIACGLKLNTEIVGSILFLNGDDSVTYAKKDQKGFQKTFGLIDNNGDALARVLVALVMTCDPSLEFNEAKELAYDVLENETYSKNGIQYSCMHYKGDYLIGFIIV